MKQRSLFDEKPSQKKRLGKSRNIPWLGIVFGIVTVAIVGVMLFMAPKWFAKTQAGNKEFSFFSSLVEDQVEPIPADLADQVAQLTKKGTGVRISFIVDNGNHQFSELFEIDGDSIIHMQTQERYFYFLNSRKAELESKIASYNQACQEQPFKAFAIAVDVTEGYSSGSFQLSEYLSAADMNWLNDAKKKSTLYIFSIGYNPIPGWRVWENINAGEINSIQEQAHNFLSQVPQELNNSAILSQIHFIVNMMKDFNSPAIVIESDMMENMPDLSAYKMNDENYNKFIQNQWAEYRKKALQEAGVSANPGMTGTLLLNLPSAVNSAYGLQQKRHAWYTAVKAYLKDTYPNMEVTSNF